MRIVIDNIKIENNVLMSDESILPYGVKMSEAQAKGRVFFGDGAEMGLENTLNSEEMRAMQDVLDGVTRRLASELKESVNA